MNIELIGTAAIYSKYHSACTLINENMMVDMPNGTLKQLMRTNHEPKNIDKILVTHLHGDHTADIPFFLMYLYKFNELDRITYIIGPVGIKNKISLMFESYSFHFEKIEKFIKFVEVNLNEIIKNDNIGYKIQVVPVSHGYIENAYGYIINDKLGISGDCMLCEGVEKIAEQSEILIADCSNIEGTIAHMGIDNLKYLSEKYNRKIITTHLKDKTREELKKLNLPNIISKEDGYKTKI